MKLIAKSIGPVLTALAWLPVSLVLTSDAEPATVMCVVWGAMLWCFAVGYIDGRNAEWVKTL